MRVSQRLDYALRAAVLLASQPPGVFIAAGDVAEHLRLPRRFVEQQITELARAGVVECRRGASGGCRLTQPASEITVLDVVTALHGEVMDVPQQTDSATTELWQQAATAMADYIGGVTLEQLAARQRQLDHKTSPMYFI